MNKSEFEKEVERWTELIGFTPEGEYDYLKGLKKGRELTLREFSIINKPESLDELADIFFRLSRKLGMPLKKIDLELKSEVKE